MAEDRRRAAWLDAELARREDAETRMAASLLELDRHPGHQLLTATTPTGVTGQRWTAAQEALAGLWSDFAAYRLTVRAARAVRGRRTRPGERELAELHRLLVEPSIEVSRTAVALPERGLTGAPERVESITLDDLGNRMEQAFSLVSDVVVATDAAHNAFLAALVPVVEGLAKVRGLAADLAVDAGDRELAAVAALTDRLAALERDTVADPLGYAAGPAPALATIEAEVAAMAARLADHAAGRDRWDADLGAARQAVADLGRLREDAEQTRRRAAELISATVPPLPPDQLGAIRASLAMLERATDWATRTDGLTALTATLDAADRTLRAADELAVGLLERRDELRGRFGAFRARAVRLGRAEEPAVLELDSQIERLLWTKPCDLGAATRALAAYRQHLTGTVPGRSA